MFMKMFRERYSDSSFRAGVAFVDLGARNYTHTLFLHLISVEKENKGETKRHYFSSRACP